jgi:PleD family two-component response regulator
VLADGIEQLISFVTWVYHDGVARVLTADDESVLEKWRGCPHLENHFASPFPLPASPVPYRMVLCVVDDLIFSVKISTAARALGTEMFFERNPDMVLPRIREKRPSLVILDLNGKKLRPLEVIAAMKSDPELRGIQTLGYVSHVDTQVISAARAAGIDEVLARSAFSTQLGTILATPPTTPGDQDRPG